MSDFMTQASNKMMQSRKMALNGVGANQVKPLACFYRHRSL